MNVIEHDAEFLYHLEILRNEAIAEKARRRARPRRRRGDRAIGGTVPPAPHLVHTTPEEQAAARQAAHRIADRMNLTPDDRALVMGALGLDEAAS